MDYIDVTPSITIARAKRPRERSRMKRRRFAAMYVTAILYEVLVPLSTAILIIINEPPGMARLSVRLHSYNETRCCAYTRRRRTMPRPRRRSIPPSIIDAPNLTSVYVKTHRAGGGSTLPCRERHLLFAGIDLTSVHAVQRGAASRFIGLHATERIG